MRRIVRSAAAATLAAAMATGLVACGTEQGDAGEDIVLHTHGMTGDAEFGKREKADPSMPADLHLATAAELVGRWALSKSVSDGTEDGEAQGSLELTDDGNGIMMAAGVDGPVTWEKGKVSSGGHNMAAFIERERGDLYLQTGDGWDAYLVFSSLEEGRIPEENGDAQAVAGQGDAQPQGEGDGQQPQGEPLAEGQPQGEGGYAVAESLAPPTAAASGTTLTALPGAAVDPLKPFTGRWLAVAVHGKEGFAYHLYDGLRGIAISPNGAANIDVAGNVVTGKWSTAGDKLTVTDAQGTTIATGVLSPRAGIDVQLTEKSGSQSWRDTVHLERG